MVQRERRAHKGTGITSSPGGQDSNAGGQSKNAADPIEATLLQVVMVLAGTPHLLGPSTTEPSQASSL